MEKQIIDWATRHEDIWKKKKIPNCDIFLAALDVAQKRLFIISISSHELYSMNLCAKVKEEIQKIAIVMSNFFLCSRSNFLNES